MAASVPPPSSRAALAKRRWASAALRSAALLVLPLLVWLGLPSRAPVARAPSPHPEAARGVSADHPGARAAAPAGASPRERTEPAAFTGADAVEGSVEDPDGKPAAGADVTCALADGELAAHTDEAGKFTLPAGAVGCKAVAKKHGFGASPEEVLHAGSGNQLRLRPPSGIAGNVVDHAGAPVTSFWIGVDTFTPAAPAGVADAGALAALKRSFDDVAGAFELTDLAAGRYELVVSVVDGPMARSQSIDVAPAAMTKGVRVVVPPPTRVSGTVTDAATHAPIEGARVYVGMGGLTTKVVPTVGGAYSIDDAPAGRFDLRAFAVGYQFKVVPGLQATPGGKALHVDMALDRIF